MNTASADQFDMQRGLLIPIGGAEDKINRRMVLDQFIQFCGGSKARIAVIPTASMMPTEAGKRYIDVFTALGAAKVNVLDIRERNHANDAAYADVLADSTGVFMTGGDQVRLMSCIGGTKVQDVLCHMFESGITVGGTSAGASAISQHMIAFGRSGSVPSQRMVQLSPGLGLTNKVIIDQHFRQRDRIGRLMTAVAFNPSMLGIGVDEDTAFVMRPDHECEVMGSGSVTIVDGSDLEYTDLYAVKQHGSIAMMGMKVHILTHGYRFNLDTLRPMLPKTAIAM